MKNIRRWTVCGLLVLALSIGGCDLFGSDGGGGGGNGGDDGGRASVIMQEADHVA